ncbi:hypothetical protein GOBAR_DD04272 [Gossypium barbadense]|nr:hypothetical protein GOBAR_DD04272 [Gossypium barbadense]
MGFDKNVGAQEMKERIDTIITRHYGRKMSRLFYKFPISFNPLKFQQIELVDEEDLGTMVEYSDPNQDEVPDVINDEGIEKGLLTSHQAVQHEGVGGLQSYQVYTDIMLNNVGGLGRVTNGIFEPHWGRGLNNGAFGNLKSPIHACPYV